MSSAVCNGSAAGIHITPVIIRFQPKAVFRYITAPKNKTLAIANKGFEDGGPTRT